MRNKIKAIVVAASFIASAAQASGIIICEPYGSGYICDVQVSGVAPHNATYQWFGTGSIGISGNQDSALVSCNSASGTINVNVTSNGTTTQVSRGLNCEPVIPPIDGPRDELHVQ